MQRCPLGCRINELVAVQVPACLVSASNLLEKLTCKALQVTASLAKWKRQSDATDRYPFFVWLVPVGQKGFQWFRMRRRPGRGSTAGAHVLVYTSAEI